MVQKITKAVIPAAGFATRFLPATKAVPKEMLPIIDIPIIQAVVEEAVLAGITNILIITRRGKNAIEEHFSRDSELLEIVKNKDKELYERILKISSLAKISYVYQTEQKGLGDAVLYAKNFVGEDPFALLLGDTLIKSDYSCTKKLIEAYTDFNSQVIGVEEVNLNESFRFGMIEGSEISKNVYKITKMVEKPDPAVAPSNLAMNGRYILQPNIFSFLEETIPDSKGEIQITSALNESCKSNSFIAYNKVGKRFDIGNKLAYIEALVEYGLDQKDLKDSLISFLNRVLQRSGRDS